MRTFLIFFVTFLYTTLNCAMNDVDSAVEGTKAPQPPKSTSVLTVEQADTLCLANQGDSAAQFSIGKFYYDLRYEHGLAEGNKIEAFRLLECAAKQEHPDAQNLLGKCYYHGIGVSHNTVLAAYWYTRSAAHNNAQAQFNLGRCYYDGVGFNMDQQKAVELYRCSAEKGVENAQLYLGQCYLTGNGVAQDLHAALTWLAQAANQGNAIAQYLVTIKQKKAY